jgi:hypothetical protein
VLREVAAGFGTERGFAAVAGGQHIVPTAPCVSTLLARRGARSFCPNTMAALRARTRKWHPPDSRQRPAACCPPRSWPAAPRRERERLSPAAPHRFRPSAARARSERGGGARVANAWPCLGNARRWRLPLPIGHDLDALAHPRLQPQQFLPHRARGADRPAEAWAGGREKAVLSARWSEGTHVSLYKSAQGVQVNPLNPRPPSPCPAGGGPQPGSPGRRAPPGVPRGRGNRNSCRGSHRCGLLCARPRERSERPHAMPYAWCCRGAADLAPPLPT